MEVKTQKSYELEYRDATRWNIIKFNDPEKFAADIDKNGSISLYDVNDLYDYFKDKTANPLNY